MLAPADEGTPVPGFVTSAGRSIRVPYNGSVARVTFGPVSYTRARRWLAEHDFDVLHLHEPTTMSLSALTLLRPPRADRGDLPHLHRAVPGAERVRRGGPGR